VWGRPPPPAGHPPSRAPPRPNSRAADGSRAGDGFHHPLPPAARRRRARGRAAVTARALERARGGGGGGGGGGGAAPPPPRVCHARGGAGRSGGRAAGGGGRAPTQTTGPPAAAAATAAVTGGGAPRIYRVPECETRVVASGALLTLVGRTTAWRASPGRNATEMRALERAPAALPPPHRAAAVRVIGRRRGCDVRVEGRQWRSWALRDGYAGGRDSDDSGCGGGVGEEAQWVCQRAHAGRRRGRPRSSAGCQPILSSRALPTNESTWRVCKTCLLETLGTIFIFARWAASSFM